MSRLQLQLRDAAEREARGGALAHAFRETRWRLRSPALAGAVAVAVFAVAVVAGVLALDGEDTTPAGPVVVAELELTGNPENMVPAFGSLWIADPVAGDVVRVDPASRKVTARIPVGSAQRIALARVGGELWVPIEQPAQILRIDPATNAVVARPRLRTPDGRPFPAFELQASERAVWASSLEGALLLDPRTAAGRVLVAAPTTDEEPLGFTLGDETLWELSTSGSIRRFDALTGAALGRMQPGLPDTRFIVGDGTDLLALNGEGSLARLDGASGRVIWERSMGDRINWFDFYRGLLWVHATTAGKPDRLTAYALADGKPVGSTALETFGATGLAIEGDEVWVNTAAGRTIVVRQPTR